MTNLRRIESYRAIGGTSPTEVDYEEMASPESQRNEICGHLSNRKIRDTCQRAKEDGYDLVCVDTCCIDRQSSAGLLETINLISIGGVETTRDAMRTRRP